MIAINIDGQINIYASIDKVKDFEDTEGREVHNLKALPQADIYDLGFRNVVRPTPPEGQKLGAIQYDDTNDVFTYPVIAKTPEELAAEAAQKKQSEAEKIKEAKVKAYVESVLTPTERLTYYPEWIAGSYALNAMVTFKGKVFKNTVEVNINAPDKGGWIEIK